jgi:hypothetical protein
MQKPTLNGEKRTIQCTALAVRETISLPRHRGLSTGREEAKRQYGFALSIQSGSRCHGLCQASLGEIEESCLFVCHFSLPKERADTYRHKILLARCPLADVLSSACGTPPPLPPRSDRLMIESKRKWGRPYKMKGEKRKNGRWSKRCLSFAPGR